MTRAAIEALLLQMHREIGASTALRGPADAAETEALPAALVPLYALTDGLSFPLGEIVAARSVAPLPDNEGWVRFGTGRGGAAWACRRDPVDGLSFATCEPGASVGEPLFASAAELLEDEYRSLVEDPAFETELTIVAVPAGTSKFTVAAELKELLPLVTTELLSELDRLPYRVPATSCATAIGVARRLHALGVECRLDGLRAAAE